MIDLNEHAQKAQEIAFNRWKKKGVEYHTPAMFQNCAGEVCENSQSHRNKLAAELADIITFAFYQVVIIF